MSKCAQKSLYATSSLARFISSRVATIFEASLLVMVLVYRSSVRPFARVGPASAFDDRSCVFHIKKNE
jgi:hypothetical protein